MIRILHHHLRRGGVTRVMEMASRVLSDAGEQVVVYSGEPPPEAFPEGVRVRVLPALRYGETFDADGASSLSETLRRETRAEDVWHVHNHSLGKNPSVTAAILDLARQGVPLVLQVHDFAEDGRPANLSRLRNGLPAGVRELYPVAPHIRYAVLQDRDRRILRVAGVPESQVVVLPNPVESPAPLAPPRHPPETILYPTRGIRRKNPGEFLYWAWRFRDSMAFATSLTPENPREKAFFAPWVEMADRLGVSVRWGVGMEGRSFRSVMEEADACITTSVGEGFGMAFLEPFAMGRTLVGRDLPEMTRSFRADGMDLSVLYDEVPVPEEALDAAFWPRATAAVGRWRAAMGLEAEVAPHDLRRAWVREGWIDFGKLDETAQRAVLARRISDLPGPELLGVDRRPPPEPNRTVVRKAYGTEGYGDRLRALYAGLEPAGPVAYADAEKVRDGFSSLSDLTLLRV